MKQAEVSAADAATEEKSVAEVKKVQADEPQETDSREPVSEVTESKEPA